MVGSSRIKSKAVFQARLHTKIDRPMRIFPPVVREHSAMNPHKLVGNGLGVL